MVSSKTPISIPISTDGISLGSALGAIRSHDDLLTPPIPVSGEVARAASVNYLQSIIGTPYIWGMKDPAKGLDCSGAVTVAYEKAGLAGSGARYHFGSADLQKVLKKISRYDAKPGDVVFYGPNNKVNHVMMYAGDDRVIGATGGGNKTRTIDDAQKAGAYVKFKPVDYRKDLISFGQAPEYEPLEGSTSTVANTSDLREFPIKSDNTIWWLVAGGIGFTALSFALFKARSTK